MEKRIEFEQKKMEKAEKKRRFKYVEIMLRATRLSLTTMDEDVDRMMDIESADKEFDMRLDDWIKADDFNFAHDFLGIRDNINRKDGFPSTDFGLFVPRFAGRF